MTNMNHAKTPVGEVSAKTDLSTLPIGVLRFYPPTSDNISSMPQDARLSTMGRVRTFPKPLRAHSVEIEKTAHCEYCGHGANECMAPCGHLICGREAEHSGPHACCLHEHHPYIMQAQRAPGYGPAAKVWYADGRKPA